jgi:hypothetical protein
MPVNTQEQARMGQRLKNVKQNIALSLNALVRDVEKFDYSPGAEKRMAHDLNSCRQALQILLTPEPPAPVSKRLKNAFIDIEDLTGEK